jgi:hypothetical protein
VIVKLIKVCGPLAMALTLVAGSAQAQSATTTDIQRLEDSIDNATRDISQLRTRDGAQAAQLEEELDEIRDEATYFKVKLRKREPVSSTEVADVRDRLEDVRARARMESSERPSASSTADSGRSRSTSGTRTSSAATVPVGTEFDVRLQTPLNSETAQVEDRFEATTMVDLMDGEHVLVPAGSVMRGIVQSVTKAGRLERKGSLTVVFDQLTVRGKTHRIRATVTEALESEGLKGETARIGAGAGVGAIIGGILGGFKGALAGILIGGGGTIAATEGKDVELPAGTVLRVRLDTPLEAF